MAPRGLLLVVVVLLAAGCGRAPESDACRRLSRFEPEAASDAAHAAFQAGRPQLLAVRERTGTAMPGAMGRQPGSPAVIADESQATGCPDLYYRAYAYAQAYNEALLSEQAFGSVPPGS
jgi:hypothetical protein